MLVATTPISEVIRAIQNSALFDRTCHSVDDVLDYFKTTPDMPFEDAVGLWSNDPALANDRFVWAMASFYLVGEELSPYMYGIHLAIIKEEALAANDGGYYALDVLRNCSLISKDRTELINKITDAMCAFHAYLMIADLTDAEDTLLETKFVGLLPTAEKELDDGVVVRKKLTAITPG